MFLRLHTIHRVIFVIIFFGSKSYSQIVPLSNSKCLNPINIDEYYLLYESVIDAIQIRNVNIDTYDFISTCLIKQTSKENTTYQFHNSNDLDATNYFTKVGFSRYNKTINRCLSKNNISASKGLGILFEDYNFTWGGNMGDCCCLNIYKMDTINIDQVKSTIPISKYIFDYLCFKIQKTLSLKYINYRTAIIVCRIYNTIKLYNLKDGFYLKFNKIIESEEVLNELREVLNYRVNYPFSLFDIGDYSKKASSYEIVDITNPVITYKFK